MRRTSSSSVRAHAGMTLIELMVAVALLAVLAVMAYRGLDAVTRAGDHTRAEGERWRVISLFFDRLGTDVGLTARRPVRAGDGSVLPEWLGQALNTASDAAMPEDKVNAQLEFTRKSPAGNDEVRLGYRLRNNRAELMIWRVLDRAPASTADIHPLLDGVTAMRISHLDSSGAWHETWPSADKAQVLPRAVAVELTLSDGIVINRIFALP